MIINGVFYTFYWRRHNNGDGDRAFQLAIFAISCPWMPFIGIIYTLIDTFIISLYSRLITIACFALVGLLFCYYLWHGRYKKIIKQHDKYNRKLYRVLANLWWPISMSITLGYVCLLRYFSSLGYNFDPPRLFP